MDIWDALEQDLQAEGVFMSHRLQAELLKERYQANMASAAFDADGHIIGFCAVWSTDQPTVVELGTVWVHPDYRGKIYGRRRISEAVVADCTAKLAAAGLRGIMVVGHRRAEELALSCGWQIDARGDCQALRWALSGVDRPPQTDSAKASVRTALVFRPK